MDPAEFYRIVKSPPAELLDDYPWLKKILADAPKGASLEGFLWPATYRVLPDTTPEELVRLMLDKFIANVGEATPGGPEGARADLLPGPDAGVDRRARGGARRRNGRSSRACTRTGSTASPASRTRSSMPTRPCSTRSTPSSSASSPFDDWTTLHVLDADQGVPWPASTLPGRPGRLQHVRGARPVPGPIARRACPRSTRRSSPTRTTSTSTSWPSPMAAARTPSPRR